MTKLFGCTPEPLGNYLKGLGVFRLIAEQTDACTRAWWKEGFLWLHSKWSQEQLVDFFISGTGEEQQVVYSPTPIFAPWGGRPGFFEDKEKEDENKKAKDRLGRLKGASSSRFESAKNALTTIDSVLNNRGWRNLSKKDRAKQKTEIVAAMRNFWTSSALDWYDACLSLEEDPRFGFLYGTGGNEGSADITNNFWELIEDTLGPWDNKADVKDESAAKVGNVNKKSEPIAEKAGSKEQLAAAMFGSPRMCGVSRTAGQHFPLASGSANYGQSFVGSSSTNPWDVILMMEGAVLFAGSTTKRLSQLGKGKAAFPFMIDHLATGAPSTAITDETTQDRQVQRCRAEFWMPLWQSPTSLPETKALLSEGRLQRRSGENTEHTLHAMEAIQDLGVARGVETFQRVALFERRGKGSYLASSLGFHATAESPLSFTGQLSEIEVFRQQVYYNLREGPGIPTRIIRARERFHIALSNLLKTEKNCAAQTSYSLLDILITAAAIEREVASIKGRSEILKPCPALSKSWISENDTGPEYDLALAIGQISPWGTDEEKPTVESIRANILPLTRWGKVWKWDEKTRAAVWMQSAPIESNLIALLRRRIIDSRRGSGDGLPLWSFHGASFESLLAFWHGALDEHRLAALISALSMVNSDTRRHSVDTWQARNQITPDLHTAAIWFDKGGRAHTEAQSMQSFDIHPDEYELRSAFQLPRIYHLFKLCFVGGRLPARPSQLGMHQRSGSEPFPPPSLDILSLLESGHVAPAIHLALSRLTAKGYPALVNRFSSYDFHDIHRSQARRLAAMLLIPVRQPGVLAAIAIKPQSKI